MVKIVALALTLAACASPAQPDGLVCTGSQFSPIGADYAEIVCRVPKDRAAAFLLAHRPPSAKTTP